MATDLVGNFQSIDKTRGVSVPVSVVQHSLIVHNLGFSQKIFEAGLLSWWIHYFSRRSLCWSSLFVWGKWTPRCWSRNLRCLCGQFLRNVGQLHLVFSCVWHWRNGHWTSVLVFFLFDLQLFATCLAYDAVDNVWALAADVVLAWVMSACYHTSETLILQDQQTKETLFVGAYSFEVASVGFKDGEWEGSRWPYQIPLFQVCEWGAGC